MGRAKKHKEWLQITTQWCPKVMNTYFSLNGFAKFVESRLLRDITKKTAAPSLSIASANIYTRESKKVKFELFHGCLIYQIICQLFSYFFCSFTHVALFLESLVFSTMFKGYCKGSSV